MFDNVLKARCVLCGEVDVIYDKVDGKNICVKCYDKIPVPCDGCWHDGFCKYQQDGSDVAYCGLAIEKAEEYVSKNEKKE